MLFIYLLHRYLPVETQVPGRLSLVPQSPPPLRRLSALPMPSTAPHSKARHQWPWRTVEQQQQLSWLDIFCPPISTIYIRNYVGIIIIGNCCIHTLNDNLLYAVNTFCHCLVLLLHPPKAFSSSVSRAQRPRERLRPSTFRRCPLASSRCSPRNVRSASICSWLGLLVI